MSEAVRAVSGADGASSVRQVRLKLVSVGFWSAVKLSFLIGLCVGIVTLVGAFLVWTMLNQLGIFTKLDTVLTSFVDTGTNLKSIVSLGQVMSFTVIVAILDVVVVTILGAIFAVLYNLSVKITGGLSVGFRNR
ncbi:MAG TPA: DUF3566 domain-containing protein [Microbacteriaceae bacterium]|nr:DUF3566 domain-containing protein [Microbacteriaceae bacterium]